MFDRAIKIEHKQIPKRYFNNYNSTQHIERIFWYLAVLINGTWPTTCKISF